MYGYKPFIINHSIFPIKKDNLTVWFSFVSSLIYTHDILNIAHQFRLKAIVLIFVLNNNIRMKSIFSIPVLNR